MAEKESVVPRRELPTTGSITGIRGIKELWTFFEALLTPLGFDRKSTGLSTAEYAGAVSGRDLSIKLIHRKRSKYFGTADHMSRVRTFQGLDVEVTLPIKVRNRVNIGTRVGGNGVFRRFLLRLVKRTGARPITHDHPMFRSIDILAHDTIWMERFLGDPLTINLLQELMDDAKQLVSWSVKLTPGKMVINRRFSSLASTNTDSLDKQLKQIASLADVAESIPAGKEIPLSRMERLQKDSPGKALALAGLYLFALLVAGTTLLLTPFLLILWLR